jgi:hypothetical protein
MREEDIWLWKLKGIQSQALDCRLLILVSWRGARQLSQLM